MGSSASTLAANQRFPYKATVCKTGARQMLARSAFADTHYDRYIPQRGRQLNSYEFTLDAIRNLVLKSTEVEDGKEEPSVMSPEELWMCGNIGSVDDMKRPKKSLSKQLARSRKLTIIRFLTALEDAMVNESFTCNVDYFSLHMRSYRLLQKLRTKLNSMLINHAELKYIQTKTKLLYILAWTFRAILGPGAPAQTGLWRISQLWFRRLL